MEFAQRLSPGRAPPKKSGLAEPVGTNTKWRSVSTDSGAHALAALAFPTVAESHSLYIGLLGSRGMGSQRRRRSHEIVAPLIAFLELRTNVLEQIDHTLLVKVEARLARRCIQRK